MEWLQLSILTLILWGLWSFLIKLSSLHLDLKSILVYESLGSLIVSCALLFLMRFKPDFNVKGIVFAALAGISLGVGGILFVYALSKGRAAIVISLTALYPAIAVLLTYFFLGEQISLKHFFGIMTALVAFVLLAN